MPETRIRFYRNDNPISPREWDNLGHMVCWHSRYILGDNQPDLDPHYWQYAFESDEAIHVMLPLYLMDHSGITMSVGPFGCPWDSGQVGWIYATPADTELAGICWDIEQIIKELTNEVQTYAMYLEGGSWGYVMEVGEECDLGHIHWEHQDSCFGFYGELKESGALDYIPDEYHEFAIKQWETTGVEVP